MSRFPLVFLFTITINSCLLGQSPFLFIENGSAGEEVTLNLGFDRIEKVLAFDLRLDLTEATLLSTSFYNFSRIEEYYPKIRLAGKNVNPIAIMEDGIIRLVALELPRQNGQGKLGSFTCKVDSQATHGVSQLIKLYGHILHVDNGLQEIEPIEIKFTVAGDIQLQLEVSPDSLGLDVNEEKSLDILVKDQLGQVVPDIEVNAEVDNPNVIATQVDGPTNTNGRSKIFVSGIRAGLANIKIQVIGQSKTVFVPVSVLEKSPPIPSKYQLSVKPTTLRIKIGQAKNLEALVEDDKGSPIPNIPITFTANEPKRVRILTQTRSTTNSKGQAKAQVMGLKKGKIMITVGIKDSEAKIIVKTKVS